MTELTPEQIADEPDFFTTREIDFSLVAKWWRVEVSMTDGPILAIEPELLAGEEHTPEMEATIAYAAENLASFVGHRLGSKPIRSALSGEPVAWRYRPNTRTDGWAHSIEEPVFSKPNHWFWEPLFINQEANRLNLE